MSRRTKLWKINFSRPEKKGEVKWTYQAQVHWSPFDKTYKGEPNVHLPDAWAYLQFGDDESGNNGVEVDAVFPARLAAMNVYYAQHAYKNGLGKPAYAKDVQTLLDAKLIDTALIPDATGAGTGFGIKLVDVSETTFRVEARLTGGPFSGAGVSVRQDRLTLDL